MKITCILYLEMYLMMDSITQSYSLSMHLLMNSLKNKNIRISLNKTLFDVGQCQFFQQSPHYHATIIGKTMIVIFSGIEGISFGSIYQTVG